MKISTKELCTYTRQLLEAVERGEEVTITYRGQSRARIVPLEQYQLSHDETLRKCPLFGIWQDRVDIDDVETYLNELRKSRY
ncbi:MAG: type II toxin-antitoxin system prevent-host-death family antitoxin [Candidatus Competibacteraceae bacterium]